VLKSGLGRKQPAQNAGPAVSTGDQSLIQGNALHKNSTSPELKDFLWGGVFLPVAILMILTVWMRVVTIAQNNEELAAVLPRGPVIKDFVNFYEASVMFNAGEKHVYDPAVLLALQNKLIAPVHAVEVFAFPYPPYVLPLFAPVAWVPPAASYMLWCLFGLVLGVCGSIILMRSLRGRTKRQTVSLLLLCTLSFPSVLSLDLGQITWWILGFFMLFTWCLVKSRDVLAGIILAVCAIKPHYAIFLGLPALAMKRWAIIFAALLTESLLIVWTGSATGWDNIINYPSSLATHETVGMHSGVYADYMSSVRAVFAIFFPADIALTVSILTMLAGLFLALYMWIVVARSETGFGVIHRWAMALSIVLGLVVSPHCYDHDLLLLALPAILTLSQSDSVNTKSNWFAGWFLLLATYPATSWLFCTPSILETVKRLPNLAVMLGLLICGGAYFGKLVKDSRRTRLEALPH
jgi:hypothetical protein